MYGASFLKNVVLGKIIGVAWRPKGSVIGVSIAIPEAGIPEEIRTSPRDAYYYIIDDGGGKPFLRQCREINIRPLRGRYWEPLEGGYFAIAP